MLDPKHLGNGQETVRAILRNGWSQAEAQSTIRLPQPERKPVQHREIHTRRMQNSPRRVGSDCKSVRVSRIGT